MTSMKDEDQRSSVRIMFPKNNPDDKKEKQSLKIKLKKTFQKEMGRREVEVNEMGSLMSSR